MQRHLRITGHVAIALFGLFAVGCPHRSPLWSPDGKLLLVLAGQKGEEVDKAASELWVVEVESGRARLLEPPEAGMRYLGVAWIDDSTFVALGGLWKESRVEEGSGKLWLRSVSGKDWRRIPAPTPNEERAPRRPPVVLRRDGDTLLVYPAGREAVTVSSLTSGKEILRLDRAELGGPGPQGGFLVTVGTELVAYAGDLQETWRRKFSELRGEISARLGKKPNEIIFDDCSSSHLPPGKEKAEWVGVTLVYNDVAWQDGIHGFYVQLGASDGALKRAAGALGLSGQPAASGGLAWCVTAPDRAKKTPPALREFDLTTGKIRRQVLYPDLRKEAVHGYALDPRGKRLALSLNGEPSRILVYDLSDLENPRTVKLARTK